MKDPTFNVWDNIEFKLVKFFTIVTFVSIIISIYIEDFYSWKHMPWRIIMAGTVAGATSGFEIFKIAKKDHTVARTFFWSFLAFIGISFICCFSFYFFYQTIWRLIFN